MVTKADDKKVTKSERYSYVFEAGMLTYGNTGYGYEPIGNVSEISASYADADAKDKELIETGISRKLAEFVGNAVRQNDGKKPPLSDYGIMMRDRWATLILPLEQWNTRTGNVTQERAIGKKVKELIANGDTKKLDALRLIGLIDEDNNIV